MTGTCEYCDGAVEWKNAAGWFRDVCADCCRRIADEEPTHYETCDDPDCGVCLTYEHEP